MQTQNFDYYQFDYNKFMAHRNQFYHGDNFRTLLEDVDRAENDQVEKGRSSKSPPNINKSKSPVPSTSNQPTTSEQSCPAPTPIVMETSIPSTSMGGNQPKKDSK